MSARKLRTIDLYAGIGGWAIGLKLAGFEIVKSYEWWGPAAATHRLNSASDVIECDIRQLALEELPEDIDVVVGSPPCTQFSYSNRGGSGDINDGLKDIEKFFEIVAHLKPTHWALENVPRVEHVIRAEISSGGRLERFANLLSSATITTVDMSEFGLPQKRKRCIVGNFDMSLLTEYKQKIATKTLGDVVAGLERGRDPNYGDVLETISEQEKEEVFDWEEERYNREMKSHHPVYNGMSFPDEFDRPSRTVTATCTRVSRESIVIFDEAIGGHRRLTIRERASLQGFPAAFGFSGKNYNDKIRMAGNAIPPTFTYLVGCAFARVSPNTLKLTTDLLGANVLRNTRPSSRTAPDRPARKFPRHRRFRFAIPGLRFKSGTRFELSNANQDSSWGCTFFYGDSKRIIEAKFNERTLFFLQRAYPELSDVATRSHRLFVAGIPMVGSAELQSAWVRQSVEPHPFKVIDNLGKLAEAAASFEEWNDFNPATVQDAAIAITFNHMNSTVLSAAKIRRNAKMIVIGALLISVANMRIISNNKADHIAAE